MFKGNHIKDKFMSDLETTMTEQAPETTMTVQAPKRKAKTDAPVQETDTPVQETVTIMIASTERDSSDVFVAVNGHNFMIQRDQEVTVPKYIYDLLKSAKETVYKQSKDRATGEVTTKVIEVSSYPVTLV
jgi:aromatic ring-opening dioxygenase LigB subunit